MKKSLAALWLLAASSLTAQAQSFVNLDFESAVVAPNDPTFGFLDWSLAAPGWSHSAGADTSTVYYRNTHVGLTQWYLLADATSRPADLLAGSYSMVFSSGLAASNATSPPWVNAYLAQTGLVPLGTRSLSLLASGPLELWVGGSQLALTALGGRAFAADLSSFAGSVVELKFVNAESTLFNPVAIDNIAFSPVAVVPEPATACLFGVGALWLAARRRAPA